MVLSPWCQQQRSVRSQSINDDELEKFTWQQNVKVSLSSQSLNTGNIVTLNWAKIGEYVNTWCRSKARCRAAAGAGWRRLRRGRGCRWSRRSSCAWSCWQLGTDHFISCHHGKTLRRQVTGKNVIFTTLKNIYIKISTGYWQMLNGYLCFILQ